MDKLTGYRELVEQYISHVVELVNRQYKSEDGGGVAHSVLDEERNYYALIKAGWCKGRRSHGTTLFVRLQDGKIYIEEDWTEHGIANVLLEAGVPNEDIVLAFQSPETRKYAEAQM